MKDYILNANINNPFECKLALAMQRLIYALMDVNVLDERLMINEKHREISLFGSDLALSDEYFGKIYSTHYMASLAELAQAHRHRTISYQMEFLKEKDYFIPPIIEGDEYFTTEWILDMDLVKDLTPQGELVLVNESGKYIDFILKCKERLCSAAQYEVMNQTREILLKYRDALIAAKDPLADDIEKYTHGARCTFPDYDCTSPCKYADGITLKRKI